MPSDTVLQKNPSGNVLLTHTLGLYAILFYLYLRYIQECESLRVKTGVIGTLFPFVTRACRDAPRVHMITFERREKTKLSEYPSQGHTE